MRVILVFLVLILVFLQFRLWSGSGSLENISALERQIAEQEAANAELLARNEALRKEVRDLKTGQDSIEERARNELGLIKKGETFYMIVEEDGNADIPREQASPPADTTVLPVEEPQ